MIKLCLERCLCSNGKMLYCTGEVGKIRRLKTLKKNINTQTVLERFKEDKGEDNISQQQRYHLEIVKLVVLILLLLAV